MTHSITVSLGSRSYPIYIGAFADGWAAIARQIDGRKAVIITDQTVASHFGPKLRSFFPETPVFSIEPGEASKSLSNYASLAERILAENIRRDSLIIAVGGGVVGDLAGFLAGTLMRGVGFIQVPTTLLAQVDSSVGGKTGVNTHSGKNLVGVFHQPDAVICDPAFLETLPEREYRAGLAEVLKYGLIADSAFLDWLLDNAKAIDARDPQALAYIVQRSCEIKADIVGQDEFETTDIRMKLNYGHTFGHALEHIAKYDGSLLHGEAVAIGMHMAATLSQLSGLLDTADVVRVKSALGALKLPATIAKVSPERMMEIMAGDKKADSKGIRFVALKKIGQADILRVADPQIVRQAIESALTQ